jgi:hypothetical protein
VDTYVEPKIRSVSLRAALAFGAAAVAGAFGVGYSVAQSPGQTVRATAIAPAGDTFSGAAAESLVLKRYQRGDRR